MTGLEARTRAVAEYLLDHVPDDIRAECQTLVQLDPSAAGMRVFHEPDGTVAFVWVGRWLGSVSAHWLLTGEDDPQ